MAGQLCEAGMAYVKGFGSSDCHCKSQLFYSGDEQGTIGSLMRELEFREVLRSAPRALRGTSCN